MIFFYRILINIILLISPLIILIRIIKKKEHPIRFKEKFCYFSKKKIKNNLIWFHGASVGEILSVVPLIEKFEKDKNIHQILITSNTLSSSKIIKNLKLKKTIHQFFPIDSNYFSKKFLEYWKPAIAIFIDSEIWPNMILDIKKKNIPLILLNGRINKKSFLKWKKLDQTAKFLFNKFDMCYPSSKESNIHLKSLGIKKTKYIGNLKFSQTEKDEHQISIKQKKFFKTRIIWCASSTHNSEEILIGTAHKKLKKKYKNLITIIIPRHIERTNIIINQLEELDLNVHRHSYGDKIKKNTDIYLVDAYGKTKSFYSLCKIVFLGGSIIRHGGQNPLEPARYGCKILHGPHIWNFGEIYQLLKEYSVSSKINSMEQLIKQTDKDFIKKSNSLKIKTKIKNIGDKILNSTFKELRSFVKQK
ncbi:3-deoxy-D-manno-octulosonic acid transferase [bacterium]|jgi:3-deoxy-D-manno-octulosonic-acid transferase|nr:3-deoxy-D-manno-octulosonic acid transferase [bacterium]